MKQIALAFAILTALISAVVPAQISAQTLNYLGSYGPLQSAVEIISKGEYVYIADRDMGLIIISVADPSSPLLVAAYDPPLNVNDIELHGDTAFIAAGSTEPDQGALYIVDISDKQSPVFLGSMSFYYELIAVTVDKWYYGPADYAYLSDGEFLLVVDVSNPLVPYIVSSLQIGAAALEADTWLYASCGETGVRILNIADPLNPWVVFTCDTPGSASETVSGRYYNNAGHLYVADGDSGIQVIEIWHGQNPPEVVGHVSTPGLANDISYFGCGFIGTSIGDSGIAIIDMLDPAGPQIIFNIATTETAQALSYDRYISVVSENQLDMYFLETDFCDYVLGDINGNGSFNGIDVVYGVSYFKGGNPPYRGCDCRPEVETYPFYAAGDLNGDCIFNGLDIIYLVSHLKWGWPFLIPCPECMPR